MLFVKWTPCSPFVCIIETTHTAIGTKVNVDTETELVRPFSVLEKMEVAVIAKLDIQQKQTEKSTTTGQSLHVTVGLLHQ